MPKIHFTAHDGTEQTVEAKAGMSLMEAAVQNSVVGIDADCGGSCACATCHVYIDPAFLPLTGTPDDMETSMLEFAEDVKETSRLSCQIIVSDVLEGMLVNTPESQ